MCNNLRNIFQTCLDKGFCQQLRNYKWLKHNPTTLSQLQDIITELHNSSLLDNNNHKSVYDYANIDRSCYVRKNLHVNGLKNCMESIAHKQPIILKAIP